MSARLLGAADAAAYLGIGRTLFIEQVAPDLASVAVHIGRRVLFDRSDLDEWVESRKGGHQHVIQRTVRIPRGLVVAKVAK